MTDPATSPILSFQNLQLPAALMRGIDAAGFEYCTPIQAQTLPLSLRGQDIAGQAQTGTGKTAAFLISMLAKLLTQPAKAQRPLSSPRGFILAPTRELAVQIHKDATLLGQYTGVTLGLAFGGVDYEKQRLQLAAGVDILIGTPGRVIDFYKQRVFDLQHVEAVVLDEADRMFDLGFISDIRYLMRRLPPAAERLSMLFSATLSQRVLELAFEHMNDPVKISIEPEQVTAERIKQTIYFPAMNEKNALLLGLIQRHASSKTMVFCNMKRTVERVEAVLQANGVNAAAMSGDVPQTKRLRMLNDFHSGRLKVLIATDVAARGLHIPAVTHVFNYDLPQDAEDYVHRIGRTARAGASGDAISFGCEDTVQVLPDIERYIGAKIPVQTITSDLLVPVIDAHPSSRGATDSRHPPARPRHAPARSGQARSGHARPPHVKPGQPRPGSSHTNPNQSNPRHAARSPAGAEHAPAHGASRRRGRHRARHANGYAANTNQNRAQAPALLSRGSKRAWVVGAVALSAVAGLLWWLAWR